MIETVAAVFGMGADDFVKVVGALCGGAAMVMTAFSRVIIALRGARRRAFVKIRRIENILLEQELNRTGGAELTGKFAEMRADQRDEADQRDSE